MQVTRLSIACMTGCLLIGASCSRKHEGEPPAVPPENAPAASAAPNATARTYDPTEILVRVGDTALTRAMADEIVNQRYGLGVMTNIPASKAAIVHDRALLQVIEQFVTRNLLLAEAERKAVTATEADIEDAHSRILAKMTKEERIRALKTKESDDHLRQELSSGIRVEKLLQEALPPIGEPTEAELASFVEENRERLTRPELVDYNHILLSVQATDSDAVKDARKAQAEAIREKLLAGEDFAAMATTHSACPSRQNGGHFERPLSHDQVAQVLKDPKAADAVFAQQTNAVGPIVETPYGYHIAKLTGRHPGGVPEGDELVKIWKSYKHNRAMQAYLIKLRETIPVTFLGQSGGEAGSGEE